MAVDPLARRILRPYLPVLVAFAVFLAIVTVVSPAERAVVEQAGVADVPFGPSGSSETAGPGVDIGGSAGSGGGSAPGETSGTDGRGPDGRAESGSGSGSNRGVGSCPDRSLQVPGDPYSPPCLTFTGDNGGATATGVSQDEIVVTVRVLEGPSAAEIFSDLSGESVEDSPESYLNTLEALGQYFSERFQFYGRSLRFEIFTGQGNGATELLGGGREAALADAVEARQRGAFADISGITIPYADALVRQEIVNIGAPYPSRDWFTERRPYAWSLFPDGTIVAEAGVAAVKARLQGQSTAEYAGEDLRGKPRVYGLIAPENAEYQESVERFVSGVGEAGIRFAVDHRYKVDINSMPNQASNIIAQMKDAGVTTIICACDPVMLALGLAPKANEQDYEPEWMTGGLAFVEQDIVAQLIHPRQWQHAFGTAFNAESEPLGSSAAYHAFKSIRPTDEPAFGVEVIYYQLYLLALGIHLAGPNLTPQTFEAGLFSYPGASGPQGYWIFGPGDYTPTNDFREIWWDPERISPQNNEPGAWVQVDGGARYFADTIPTGPTKFFEDG